MWMRYVDVAGNRIGELQQVDRVPRSTALEGVPFRCVGGRHVREYIGGKEQSVVIVTLHPFEDWRATPKLGERRGFNS